MRRYKGFQNVNRCGQYDVVDNLRDKLFGLTYDTNVECHHGQSRYGQFIDEPTIYNWSIKDLFEFLDVKFKQFDQGKVCYHDNGGITVELLGGRWSEYRIDIFCNYYRIAPNAGWKEFEN